MMQLIPERPDHATPIDALLDAAFGPARTAKQSYAYRRGVAPISGLGLVAVDGDRLLGTIRYWPVTVGATQAPSLLLGPIAVAEEARGTGLGRDLVEISLAAARRAGHRRVLLVGDPDLYGRFGFGPAAGYGIVMPGEQPRRFCARSLVPGAFDGVRGPVWPARTQPVPFVRPAALSPAQAATA